MNVQDTDQRICRFPECSKAAAASESGSGRPPEYCSDPEHNRAAAWRARQAAKGGDSPELPDERPVEAARQRASAIRGQVTEMGEHFIGQFRSLLDDLQTISDPDAVEAQLESVEAEAAEQIAAAGARAIRAEQAQRRAEIERAEADAAAEEALAAAAERTSAATTLEEQLGELRAEVQDLSQAHETELGDLRQELTAAIERHTAAEGRAYDLERDFARVREQLRDAEQEAADATQRAAVAERATAQSEQAGRVADERATSATTRGERAEADLAATRTRVDELRDELSVTGGQLATVIAERDAARAATEDARVYGEQRVVDLRTSYYQQFQNLRAEHDAAVKDGAIGQGPSDVRGNPGSDDEPIEGAPVAKTTRRKRPPAKGTST